MKAPRFKFAQPATVRETYGLLEEYGDRATILAGGQSLLAGLGMRLAAPEVLIDINALTDLAGISLQGNNIVIGALTRHADTLSSSLIKSRLPLIAEAITHVGHMAIRNRGTFGGSLAYADPAAELPACVVAYGATIVIGGHSGSRHVPAEQFFKGMMETDLRSGELILEVRIPVQMERQRHVFSELSRRHGDFALAGLAGIVLLDGDCIGASRLVYFGCVSHAAVAQATSSGLVGMKLPMISPTSLLEPLQRDIAPDDSPGMRATTKLHLASVLTQRALNSLLASAKL